MLTIKSTVILFLSFSFILLFLFVTSIHPSVHTYTYTQPKKNLFFRLKSIYCLRWIYIECCFVLCEDDQNNWIYRDEKKNVNDCNKKWTKRWNSISQKFDYLWVQRELKNKRIVIIESKREAQRTYNIWLAIFLQFYLFNVIGDE